MAVPTLLVPGSLKIPEGAGAIAPVDYIVNWLKTRMSEFGGHDAELKERVLIVKSETGSGKSTVLPVHVFRILRSEKTHRGLRYSGQSVLCTQPRILTAIDLARRQVGGSKHYPDLVLGQTVGFQTGPFSERPPRGLIFATIGVLAAQLRTMEDAAVMGRYRFIIIDEAHERSAEADVTLLMLKNFYARNVGNEKLPFLILASATIEPLKYAAYFGLGEDNVVEVTGRAFDIVDKWPEQGTNDYPKAAAELAVRIHEEAKDAPGKADILIFVPGAAEMRAVRAGLEKKIRDALVLSIDREAIISDSRDYQLLTMPLERLPGSPGRRIIVSTVVAETGLTLDNLRYVIDCGWSRTRETYQPDGVTGLVTRPAPQSRVKQRRGRVGRLFDGVFCPLYTHNVYQSLDPQQMPDVVTNGLAPIMLDLVEQQQTQKSRLGALPDFRVEEIDLLEMPPADAVIAALETGLCLGFVSRATGGESAPIYGLTELGRMASKLSRTSQEAARIVLSGFLWKCSIRDLITIVAFFGMPLEKLRPRKGKEKKDGDSVLKSALPGFVLRRELGAPADSAWIQRAKLLIADDFIEALLVFSAFQKVLDTAEWPQVLEWCNHAGIDISKLTEVARRREEVVEDLLVAGVNIYWGEEFALRDTKADDFSDQITRLKKCLYDGLRLRLLQYDSASNKYRTRLGLAVEVPPLLADSELKKGATRMEKPQYIVTDSVNLKLVENKEKTLLYRVVAGLVSVMDGYVDVDPGFATPLRPGDPVSKESLSGERRPEGRSLETALPFPEEARAPDGAIDAYAKICRASLGKLCSPAFQAPDAFSARQRQELIKKPFAFRECKFPGRI